jgi:RNA recognition motif-containing protein
LLSCSVEFAGARSGRDDRGGRGPPSSNYTGRHTEYRATLKNLPRTASWQDVKDFFKDERLDVLFTDVSRDGTGSVEFGREEDLNFALDKMNGRQLKSHLVGAMPVQLRVC